MEQEVMLICKAPGGGGERPHAAAVVLGLRYPLRPSRFTMEITDREYGMLSIACVKTILLFRMGTDINCHLLNRLLSVRTEWSRK